MSQSHIETDLDKGILKITLNRPEKYNSFIQPMAKELHAALDDAAKNEEVRCVLLTGKGKAFCAGQDLQEAADQDDDFELGDAVRSSYNPTVKGIRTLEKPVVAAVNGTAAGAGANLALCCDLVLASTDSVFVQSFSKIGLIPDCGGTFFLPRLVGMQQANALYMLDDEIDGKQAEEMGLIYKAVKADKLMNEANDVCTKLASMPTKGFGLYKEAINQSLANNLDDHLEVEADLQTKAGQTKDYEEGVQAFLEKREPDYEGK